MRDSPPFGLQYVHNPLIYKPCSKEDGNPEACEDFKREAHAGLSQANVQ